MSLHKLTAGNGYDYLTRQVAAMDSTEKGHTTLASYYTETGETPGAWMGAGMAGLDGLNAGDVVTAEQMHALFGLGLHPLAGAMYGDRATAELAVSQVEAAARLGSPFRLPDKQVSDFRIEVARRVAAASVQAGGTTRDPVATQIRAEIRTTVAGEFFRAEHDRAPVDARELAGAVARYSRGPATPVAGFDLTFSPVKSVSALWAVADPKVAAQVEIAHNKAVADALAFIEKEALFTRLGAGGVRQVDVHGLVAAAFTHRDSRAGDPDLHTHVAVANKVQTLDGAWRAIDGRVLYKAAVTASEVYNTAIEKHLAAGLGVRFAARDQARPDARPVREIVGVPGQLLTRWSTRRVSIEARRGELASQFQATHGRPPSPVEALQLAQQATLETRDAKHEPRSVAQQRATWAAEAAQVLGGRDQVSAVVKAALAPAGALGALVDAAWVDQAAAAVLDAVQTRRATWQVWHVKAEALRVARAAELPAQQVPDVVDLITDEVLTTRCIRLTRDEAGLVEPAALRRRDGSSAYTVAGAQLYSSPEVLSAEQSLLRHAGTRNGTRIPAERIEVALLEVAATGPTLNDGQAAMVRAMATSGARLQLAIAPAGSGKTTAMGALTQAWTAAGGTVLGLAPSAAAAGALRKDTGATTDTMAKLTWALSHHQPLPQWAETIGPRSLVIIDEAGMADTLSLAQIADFVIGRGGSIRLIGDTQQLAAIGAGGILRDIETTHGALRLHELVRFTDPAEAAASLALRDGGHEALGFYLDRGRVHVGDPATTIDTVFGGWARDVDAGRDAVMLAATRDQAAALNARAQTHLCPAHQGPSVALADGNHACVGDIIITRANRRDLRTSTTDFVKNGDRWDVLEVLADGRLAVAHRATRRRVTLPADYTAAWVDLGYASTINTAQGITADTSHTLLNGAESRQQAYTALTRGRHSNHLYLQVVGDGDEHSVIQPATTSPRTPADILAGILDRDTAPTSVTTQLRDQDDPRTHLADAADRYLDALHLAADQLAGDHLRTDLDTQADTIVPGLTDAPAWPTLRAQLLLNHAADGTHPLTALVKACRHDGLHDAHDVAAVLHWRIDPTRGSAPGPLPWLPAIPERLSSHPEWGPYLTQREARVAGLAAAIPAPASPPGWVRHRATAPPPDLTAEIELWRIATRTPDTDHRPTGPRELLGAAARHQSRLEARLAALDTPALDEWLPLLTRLAPTIHTDPYVLDLTERLAATSRAGLNTTALLDTAMSEHGPLPDDHAAGALWWRLHARLSPIVMSPDAHPAGETEWAPQLRDLIGAEHYQQLRDDRDWAALAATVTRATARGWTLPDLLPDPTDTGHPLDASELLWRVAIVLDPLPQTDEPEHPDALPPADLYGLDIPDNHPGLIAPDDPPPPALEHDDTGGDDLLPEPEIAAEPGHDLGTAWHLAVTRRQLREPLELTDAEINRQLERAYNLDTSPVPEARLLQLNALALDYYRHHYPGSWAQNHLIDRFGNDLHDTGIHPGYAPDTWAGLTSHLRSLGATDDELLAAGLATPARTGRLIDRFRDRVVFPITHNGKILGFVGRRHPDATDTDRRGPKYLNTSDTVLYSKGDQLYVAGDPHPLLTGAAAPVLGEGPMDAIAITLAGDGRYIGVAPLGTSLTTTQARQLASWRQDPIIATDNDPAGQRAATRDFWLLTPHRIDPHTITLPAGQDPASVYTDLGPDTLAHHLRHASSLGEQLLHHTLTAASAEALETALDLAAARPESTWEDSLAVLTSRLTIPRETVAAQLNAAANRMTTNPLPIAQRRLDAVHTPPRNPALSAPRSDAAGGPAPMPQQAAATERRRGGLEPEPRSLDR